MLSSILYAEVYLICIVLLGLIMFWSIRFGDNSASDRWFRYVLIGYLMNFGSNFFFTLFNGGILPQGAERPASYLFKTLYFITLDIAIFFWCGFSETEQKNNIFQKKRTMLGLFVIPLILIAVALTNLKTHLLFYISDSGAYIRDILFHVEMLVLLFFTFLISVRMLRNVHRETDPVRRGHFILIASFPICLLAAWLLSFIGESVPVICVCITIEILCIYIGGFRQQISLDKLTQVNNRQNLMKYISYKIHHTENELYLLLMDVDYFKSINDSFGHLEGDQALIQVANVLKRACTDFPKRPYIARYGGDEFMIVTEGSLAEIRHLCDSIRSLAYHQNPSKDSYDLRISIGVAAYQKGMSHKEFIAAADKELYIKKKDRQPIKINK